MPLLRRIEVVATIAVAFVLFASKAIAQNKGHILLAQTTILNKDTTEYEISECTALVILSKDQCSSCSKSIPDLVKKLAKSGYTSRFGIVMDRSLMDCKQDEIYLKTFIEPEPAIFFLKDKNVTFKTAQGSGFESVY